MRRRPRGPRASSSEITLSRLVRALTAFGCAVAFATTGAACNSCSAGNGSAGGDGDTGASAPGAGASASSAAGSASVDEPDEPFDEDASSGDASATIRRFRDAGPRAGLEGDGGDEAPLDPACAAPDLDLAIALADVRCAVTSSRAKKLRADLEKAGRTSVLKQDAARGDAEGTVRVRLVNTGSQLIELPLSFHPKLPSFTSLAEDDKRVVYELEPARFVAPPPGSASKGPRFARIGIAPGKAAIAVVLVSPVVMKRLDPPCEAGTCGPPRLAKGKYTLHVGELVTDVEAGAPARVPFELP